MESEPDQTIPPFPVFTYSMSEASIQKRKKGYWITALCGIGISLIVFMLSPVVGSSLPLWKVMLWLAKIEFVVCALLILLSFSNVKGMRSMKIEIEGPTIRYFGKNGRLLISAPMNQVVWLRSRKSFFVRSSVAYFVGFGKMRMLHFYEGTSDIDQLIQAIEHQSGKRFKST